MSETIQGFRLSFQQERLWNLALSTEEPFRARFALSLEGEVDPPALRAALRQVIERHEILRTRFSLLPGMQLPLQVVAAAETSLIWREGAEEPPASALGDEPVVYARLERSGHLHRLHIELPALCADAQTLINLAREIGLHYEACRHEGGVGLNGEPVQYADFAGWQREVGAAHDEAARKLWQTAGLAEALRARLPGSAGAAAGARFVPRTVRFSLPASAVERLAGGGEPAAPPSAVILAAWLLLLQRHLGTPRVMVGVAVTGRGLAELEEALGLFSRYVPCEEGIPETVPLAVAARRLASRLAELAVRQESFSWEGLDVPAGTPRFFPFGFEWRELPPAWQMDGVRFSLDEIGVLVDRFVAKLACVHRGAHLVEAELLYDAATLPPGQAELLAGRFTALLRDAGERITVPAGELDLLSESERRQVLVELNRTDADLGGAVTLAALFEARARISPCSVALAAAGEILTYGELEAQANRLARLLRRLGVGPEEPVALHVERSFDLVTSLLAVAKAGGAYVPIDPGYPRERQDHMLADCGASLLLVQGGEELRGGGLRVVRLQERPAETESPGPLPPSALPENLAYILYTSGSTGRPKGVMVSHAAIANRLLWMQREFPLTESDRVLQKTPYGFDASIWEIFVPLLAGAQVVLAEPGGHRDSRYLLDAVAHHDITVLQLVPSQLAAFVDQEGVAEKCRSLRGMFCGGEALPGAVAERLLQNTGAALCNLYGPTEAAIDASFHVCPRGEPLPGVVPIGRPLANVRIYLVDRLLRPVLPPLPGEILIGGAGLARGYLGRPELTAERFVPDPWGPPGGRLYRTGDLGRLAPGGVVEILGRIDNQVKLRGVRIELGEIEARLREHPAVRDAVVLVREDVPGAPRLVGYVVRSAKASQRDDLCELPGGLRVACVNRNEAEVVYREIFTEESYLRHGVELADGACVVDVGANIGLFTLFVKQRFPASRVLAFEPIPAIFDKLRANVSLHGLEVELFTCALAEREGSAPFTFYPRWSSMSGRYADAEDEQSVTRTILSHDRLGASDIEDLTAGRFTGEVVECPLKTLSQVLRESRVEWIDLLKIDAEKSELDVLQGIADEDWGRIGQIVIEVHDLDGRLETVRSLLAARGFAVAVEQDAFLAGTPIFNLYCVRPGRRRPPAARTASPAMVGTGAAAADLRAFLSARLPEAMVPMAILDLDELPRLPNGKVDRSALAALAPEQPARTAEPPRTPTEGLLAEIWAGVLGGERVGAHDNFFELGGHSLLATRLISRVRAAFQAEVSLRRFFDAPTIAGLAALVEEEREAARPAAPPILPVRRDRDLPLSFAQQRLWFIDQLQPGSVNYNIAMPLRIEGRLAPALLGRTLSEVVRRHEALRTRFPTVEGRGVQVIDPPRPVRPPLVDLSGLPAPAGSAEALRLAGEDAGRPFDLGRDELLRVTLLRLDPGATCHAVLFTLHHIISDGWSTGVLVREVMALYEAFAAGRPSPLPELPIQLADYAVWQREWLRGEELEAQLSFWRDRLAGAPQVLELPLDHPRPAVQTVRGASRTIALPLQMSAEVRELCRREGATPFMVLLAAWAALLGRLAGQDDVLLGTPIAGRNRHEIEDLIGFFVNTLVLRTDLSGSPGFAGLLGRVRQMVLDAYAHQDIPFERLVEELSAGRDLAHAPLFQVLFALQNAPVQNLSIEGLTLAPFGVHGGVVKFDLTLNLEEREDRRFAGALEYNTDLFDGSTVERLLARFEVLLAGALQDPGAAVTGLELLLTAERQQVLVEWNDTVSAYPREASLPGLFAAVARELPDAPALIPSEGDAWSYRRLAAAAAGLARHLRGLGVGPETRVAVCMERSPELIVSVLAVLQAGGVYVPLDAGYPDDRLAFMLADLSDGEAPLVLVDARARQRLEGVEGGTTLVTVEGELWSQAEADPAGVPVPAGSLALVIYTSGSTGRPKGVALTHRGVVRMVRATTYARWDRRDRVAHLSNISFDAATMEIWAALLHGAALVIIPHEEALSPEHLGARIRRDGVTWMVLTTALFHQVARERPEALAPLRAVMFAGEAADPSAVVRMLGGKGPEELLNGYGPAEGATISTWHRVRDIQPDAVTVPIGLPVANTSVIVLDRRQNLVPPGVVGELFIGGDGLARGYLNRPDLTAERFVPHPWGSGERLYRTGDLVRQRSDGALEFVGRRDDQVKLRGFRIEPAEIEAALVGHPEVRACAVLVREDVPGDRRLVAYIVGDGERPPGGEELRSHLRSRLPEFMIPSAFVALEALPLTPNGKVERKALPAPERTGTEGYAAPSDPVEELLAGIWAEVLGLPRVGVHDNFFALGGHSLLATQVASRIRGVLRVALPLRRLFEAPTIAALARAVRATFQGSTGPQAPPIVPLSRDVLGWELPVSFAQQRLWFLDRLEPGSVVYNLPSAVRLQGDIAVPELAWIFAEVVRRHEVLRTTFGAREGRTVQIIAPSFLPALPVVDLTDLDEAEREAQALALEEALRPFDLQRGPLLRLCVLRLGERDNVLLMTLHHIVSDGWSTGVLLREIAALHEGFVEGRPATLPELPVQYADFARWQREWLCGEVLDEQISSWRRQLAGAPRVLDLPLDRPRPSRQTFRGAVCSVALPPDLAAAVHGLCRRENATPFMVLLAAWGLLLGRHAGQQDVLVGAPVAGRNRQETEHLIGFFVNTLALRVDLRAAPCFAELVGRVRAAALDGYTHQDLPFERLVEELAVERTLAVSPLFQVVLALQNAPAQALAIEGLTLTPLGMHSGVAKFDLTLALGEQEDRGFTGSLEYNTDLFDGATIDRMLGHFATLLAECVADPRAHVWEAPLLGAAERRALLAWSGTGDVYPLTGSLPARFETWAVARPDAVAAVLADTSLTYGELDRWANRLAHRLLEAGVAPGSRVCLAVERGLGLVAGILGILKAGCAYVPLDPSYPRERLAWVLEDAGAAALVSEAEMLERLPAWPGRVLLLGAEGGREENPRVAVAPEWPAYVIYTSGSTGRPKGVVVSHGNVLRLMASTEERFGFGVEDVWTLFHSFAFDFSVWELWGALLYGGRLVVVPYLASRSPEAMLELVERETVTVLNQTPSAFQAFQHAEAQREEAGVLSLRWVIFGGEALEPRSLEGWWRRRERQGIEACGLVNMYGITETTVHVTWRLLGAAEVLDGGGSVIGVPLRDLRVHVLDPWGEPVPVGVAGELHVGGGGVSPGYLGRPELTAERFVPDGFGEAPGARLYRSGDLGRWRSSGELEVELEYLGRIDHQVKVRGFRIELGEIESALLRQPGVDAAVVLAREDTPGDRRLVAYLVGQEGGSPGIEELRDRLRASLPEHMVPSAFVALESLPLTANGKVDRLALPAPDGERPALAAEYMAPRSLVEEVLAAIWAQVLRLERVGIHDNFFALGGDSILSLRVAALARERGLEVELADLFQHQTIAGLGASVRLTQGDAEEVHSEPLSLISAADRRRLPEGIEDAYPVTLLQAGMLFHMELAPDNPPYHNVDSWHLRARFVQPLFERAVQRVVARHPVLRTSFHLTGYGEPLQLVHRRACLPVPVLDLTGLDPARQEEVLRAFVAAEKLRLLDRAGAPQLRFHVHLRTADSFQLTLTENHAILDGWSLHSTLSEIFSGYFALLAGEELPDEAPPAATFRELVRLERLALESAGHRRFWDEQLRDATTTSLPPGDGPVQAGSRGVVDLLIPPPVSAGLRRLASATMVPLKSVLLAAHLKVMALVSGRGEVLTGLTSHGRPETAGGEAVRGLFLNTLPFRFALGAGTWQDLVRDTFQAEQAVLPFRRYPLGALQSQRGGGPLFETVFNYIHFHVVEDLLRSGDVEVLDFRKMEGTNFALLATFSQSPLTSELHLGLEHDRSRLSDGRARWWLGELYQRVLAALAEAGTGAAGSHEAGSLLAESERHQLVWEWNDAASAGDRGRLVHELFSEQAACTPEAVAIEQGDRRVLYRELAEWSDALARRLAGLGIGAESRVGVSLERTPEVVALLLGVLKCGAAYVPLDPGYPAERLRFLVLDADVAVVLTQESLRPGLASVLPESVPVISVEDGAWGGAGSQAVPPGDRLGAESLAYVIYTSGSTGRPKGVAVPHRGIVRLVRGTSYLQPGPRDRVAFASSISFDAATFEIWGALLNGAALVVVPQEAVLSPAELGDLLHRHGVTTLWLTAGLFHQMVQENLSGLAGVRQLLAGGDVLSALHVRRALTELPGIRLINGYGPTENTTFTCCHSMTAPESLETSVPLGRPIAGTRVYVLDRHLQPVPAGVAGELLAGGDGLARGYLSRPDLTAERFVPDPFGREAGGRLYRTGDLVRWRPAGELEFLGRIDHQVKIRGFRIELGEIETALSQHPGVGAAVVLVREAAPGDRRLVAYVVGEDGPAPGGAELRLHLQSRLPEFMTPSAFVVLEALPLTPNGKVDRRALERIAPEKERSAEELAGPRTPAEELLAGIWAQVLGVERVGVEESFFDLGGHSLLATQVMSRIRDVFGVALPLRALFDTPSVAGLAAQIEALRSAGAAPERTPLGRAGRSRPLPLSFAQQRLWFLDQLDPGNPAYNIPAAVPLAGRLGVAALAAALGELVLRHEVLRTTFEEVAAEPVQIISPSAPAALPVIDLQGLPAPARAREAERLAEAEERLPFDLGRGPLLRSALLRLAAEHHVILLTMHHIVSDGWSRGVLVRELVAMYEAFLAGRPSPLPALPVQYADFAVWQREWLQGEVLEEQLAYWTRHLDGAPPFLALPFDRPRPARPSHRGGEHRLRIPPEVAAPLKALGRGEGTTLFMTLLAAWSILLHRYSGQTDLVVGSNIANRHQLHLEGLIGLFANTVALRIAWTEEPTVRELLARVREVVLDAQACQDFPFEKLVEALHPERDAAYHPIFQVMLVMQETQPGSAAASRPDPRPVRVEGRSAKFDLTLFVMEEADEIAAVLEYDADLFEAGTVADLAGQLAALLEALPASVDQPISAPHLVSAREEESLVGAFAEDLEL